LLSFALATHPFRVTPNAPENAMDHDSKCSDVPAPVRRRQLAVNCGHGASTTGYETTPGRERLKSVTQNTLHLALKPADCCWGKRRVFAPGRRPSPGANGANCRVLVRRQKIAAFGDSASSEGGTAGCSVASGSFCSVTEANEHDVQLLARLAQTVGAYASRAIGS